MRRENTIYHLCNRSSKVIFRNEEDYLIAICRLAACAHTTSTEIWAYAFMSTHFHLVVSSENIARFIKLFKINLATWHNKKYINNIQIEINKRALLNKGDIRTAVNYVLKNPIHHKIEEIAFRYPYSSAHIYFKDKIYPMEYLQQESKRILYKKPFELKTKIYERLFASHRLPDDYIILNDNTLLPDSFVKVDIIEKLYSSARDFMYHMNKPLQEELEMFDSSEHYFGENNLDLFGKLTDMQVCKIIDDHIYPKTYTQISPEEKSYLIRMLRQKGVDKFQLNRVL